MLYLAYRSQSNSGESLFSQTHSKVEFFQVEGGDSTRYKCQKERSLFSTRESCLIELCFNKARVFYRLF
jgi:hypothetical protein